MKINSFLLLMASYFIGYNMNNANFITKGNGNITQKVYPLNDALNIDISNISKIVLKQSDKNNIIVEIDENLQQFVEIVNNTNKVSIKTKENSKFSSTKFIVYINAKTLSSIQTNSCAEVEAESEFKTDDLSLTFLASASVNMNLNVLNLQIVLESVAKVNFTGSSKKVNTNLNSVNSFNTEQLKAEVFHLKANACNTVKIFASKELYLNINSISLLRYKGNPQIKQQKISGVANVQHD